MNLIRFPITARLSMASVRCTLLLLVAAFVMLWPGSMATDYVVGGPIGWKIPPAPTFYNDWAESNDAFHTGDTLDFEYNSSQDSVLLVTLDDYNTCNTMHPLRAWFEGPHPYALKGFSIIYFISGAPGHCAAGQKMLVKTLNV